MPDDATGPDAGRSNPSLLDEIAFAAFTRMANALALNAAKQAAPPLPDKSDGSPDAPCGGDTSRKRVEFFSLIRLLPVIWLVIISG